MINLELAAAINAVHAAEAAMPVESSDDVMNAAVHTTAAAIEVATHTPAMCEGGVAAKLALAGWLVENEWDIPAAKLANRALIEMDRMRWN